jgi:cytochrome c biogenesis protein CcmG, thiol:disulfide interchange protein DsbE
MKYIVVLLFLFFSLGKSYTQAVIEMPREARQDNDIVKTFPYNIELYDIKNDVYNSAELFKKKKKPLVLMFWLTTCGPCRMELTAIKGKYSTWKKDKDFDMVAISTDFAENHQNFIDRVTKEAWPFPAYRDVRREFSSVLPGGLNGLPQLFIFDTNGNIVYHKKRYIPGDEDAIFEKVKEL